MRSFIIYLNFVSLLAVCLFACNHHSSNPMLQQVDSLLEMKPDSALTILKNISVLEDLPEVDKAYYALLLAEATDKNKLPLLPCDSLLNFALDYYGDDDREKAVALMYLLVLQYLLINNHNDQQQHHSYHRNGVYPPFSLELFFPYLRIGIPTIGLLLQFRSHIGGIDRIFQLGADFQIFQSFLHISLLLGYGIQVKEREIPDMNIDSFLASVQIIKSRIKLPVIIIKFP